MTDPTEQIIFDSESFADDIPTSFEIIVETSDTNLDDSNIDDENTIYVCEKCQAVVTGVSNYTEHLKTHETKYNKKRGIKKVHLKTHLTEKSKCDKCGISFRSASRLLKHEHMHVQKQVYVCVFCGQSLEDRESLKVHMKTHTSVKFRCDPCGLVFSSCYALKIHELSHPLQTPFDCHFCGDAFSFKDELNRHLVTHEQDSGFSILPNYIDLPSKEPEAQNQNEVDFSGNLHKCPECSMKFATIEILRHHKVIHPKKKIFNCSSCDLGFFYNYSYLEHMCAVHGGPKPFLCSVCNVSFKKRYGLKVHQSTASHKEKAEKSGKTENTTLGV